MTRKLNGSDKIAIATEKSANSKIGPASTTYAAQVSCPTSCPLLNQGCYAQAPGPLGWMTARMNAYAESIGATADDVAAEESRLIRGLTGKRDLRLHTLGDSKTESTVRTVAAACMEYAARFGRSVWTYTHAWRVVPRALWLGVSVLASCETTKAAHKAMQRGYAAAIVVEQHAPDGKPYKADGLTIIPCPEQTGRKANCVECRLCFDDTRLHAKGQVIAFAIHGGQSKQAKAAIAAAGEVPAQPAA